MSASTAVRRTTAAAAMCAAAVLLAGCTTVMDGSAARDPGFKPGDVIPVLMQTGNYPTGVRKAPVPSMGLSRLIEAQRMAEFVIYPWEAYPTATDSDELGTRTILSPEALGVQVPGGVMPDIAQANGFLNGFTTSRGTPKDAPGPHMAVNVIVMRFPGPDQANATLAAYLAKRTPPEGSTGAHPIAIPGHPEASATAVVLDGGRPSVSSFSAHGPYIFDVFTQTDDTADAAAATIGKALDLQGPKIDQFQPTDPAQWPTMNPDPTGLLARSLPKKDATVNDGVWTSAAFLHFAAGNSLDDPKGATDRFVKFGIDRVVQGKSVYYQTKDAAAAAGFADVVAKDFAAGNELKPTVPGFPAAKCFTIKDAGEFSSRFECVAPADRYVVTVFAKQSADAIQQISAQYLMLVAK
ncbi:hypothetical protein FZI85_27130 [Mycobacterium sp. CBMA293]|nr:MULTISPECIES: hypothetical protein [unclassified Mycolicibacterium]MUL48421.1 hypothetical protein [Mycolicibacterium sp. CBMA 360]MUL62279.1 hypothetical protein [Mycolicibacterium sp. CBMA 335]MUM14679.1 hypothetical protein [Mycolicibacterium sp. CBMA 293]MUM31070.1 hypothetical protein [Mycolicibacterium sp. CBMA 361]